MGRREKKRRAGAEKQIEEFSKRMIADTRPLLWFVTVSAFLLAFLCVRSGYVGSLPWIGAMVGLPWTAHGTVCAFYLNMAKSDHSVGGITFEAAKANGFAAEAAETAEAENWVSPEI